MVLTIVLKDPGSKMLVQNAEKLQKTWKWFSLQGKNLLSGYQGKNQLKVVFRHRLGLFTMLILEAGIEHLIRLVFWASISQG